MIPSCEGRVKVEECVEEAGCAGLVGVGGEAWLYTCQAGGMGGWCNRNAGTTEGGSSVWDVWGIAQLY